jgi:hypothetical protein
MTVAATARAGKTGTGTTTTLEELDASLAGASPVVITPIKRQTVIVPIVGTTPLIVHNFSAKSRQMMLDAMQGKKAPAQKKDPEAEYHDAFYFMNDGESSGFPAIGFKSAIVSAARFYGKDVKMTELRQFIFVRGEMSQHHQLPLIRIDGEPEMREDTVRVGMGKADLRYRPWYRDWRAALEIQFVSSLIDLNSLVSLIEAAGMGVGIGEWRPEKKGEFGTFAVDQDSDILIVGQ